MPSSTSHRAWPDHLPALWFGVLAGPLAWAALLQTNYVLSYVACEHRQTWMLHLAAALAIVVIAMGGLTAWRAMQRSDAHHRESADTAETAAKRTRFMAVGGVILCAWFALVVFATFIPVLVLHPCTP
jgi:cytochrome c biogenesis factor